MNKQVSSPGEIVVGMIEALVRGGEQTLEVHPGMEHLRRLWPSVREAIPDFRAEVQQQLTQGDRVASHWVFTGTHQGKLFGIPPTGKTVRFQNISIAKVVDGQVVQYNSETGWLDFLMQVGALPLK
ncbi:MAG TPA: ester cyclase [Candidatus Dormibacteraeota bacterium]|nr:ester cyclase [Candidatus Dormibacteraeota bacterium]